MTQVVKVIGKLEIGILDAAGIGRTHLSPATEAWTHPVTLAVMRNAQLQLMLMLRPLRPRADQAHLTQKHIEQLRQFIQSQTAQDATDGRDALITNLREGSVREGASTITQQTVEKSGTCSLRGCNEQSKL